MRRARGLAGSVVLAFIAVGLSATPAAANYGSSRTELTVSPSTQAYGQPVSLSVTVYDNSTSCDLPPYPHGCNEPTGSVDLYVDGSFITRVRLRTDGPGPDFASIHPVIVATIAPGSHTIRAHYQGGVETVSNPRPFDNSEDSKPLTITKAKVGVTLSNGTPNPSTFGQSVSFNVAVAPNPAADPNAAKPTGQVQLTEGPTVLAQGAIDAAGNVTLTTSALTVGTHDDLAAVYLGDPNYEQRSSNEVTQTVTKATPGMTLSASPSPSAFGQNVTFTATLTPGTATGTVTFNVDGAVAATVPVSSGSAAFSTSTLTAGWHPVTATYNGDANFGTTARGMSQLVNKAATVTSLISSPNPTVYRQSVTLIATVSPASTTGSVTFYDGATNLGTASLQSTASGKQATLVVPSGLSTGAHTLTAGYGGDANHETSTSAGHTHTVQKASTTTSATATGPVEFGSPGTLAVTVAPVAPGAGAPTGQVTLAEGSVVLGQAALSPAEGGSTASFEVAGLLPGTHTFVATYSGDGNFHGSVSASSTVTVFCQVNITASVTGNLNVGPGSTCVTAPSVSGSVYAQHGAKLFMQGTTVGGSMNSNGSYLLAMCGTRVSGPTMIRSTYGMVVVGDAPHGRCAGNTLSSVSLTGTYGWVDFNDNVANNVTFSNNLGPASWDALTVAANSIRGSLSCTGNSPAPTNTGRPNSAYSKSGQCSGL